MRYLVIISILFFSSITCDRVSACPTCKDSLHANGVAIGYAASILLMLAMPFLIVMFWAVVIYRLRKRMVVSQVNEANVGDYI